MDNIQFIPSNQRNIDISFNNRGNKNKSLLSLLILLFIIYFCIVLGCYWFFVIQEQNKINNSIGQLDAVNSEYYLTEDLEQLAFNTNDLITKYYDPTLAIKSIESAYIPNIKVNNISYSKLDKSINLSIVVPSINDVTVQVDNFKKLESVAKVDFSTASSSNNSIGYSVGISIVLK